MPSQSWWETRRPRRSRRRKPAGARSAPSPHSHARARWPQAPFVRLFVCVCAPILRALLLLLFRFVPARRPPPAALPSRGRPPPAAHRLRRRQLASAPARAGLELRVVDIDFDHDQAARRQALRQRPARRDRAGRSQGVADTAGPVSVTHHAHAAPAQSGHLNDPPLRLPTKYTTPLVRHSLSGARRGTARATPAARAHLTCRPRATRNSVHACLEESLSGNRPRTPRPRERPRRAAPPCGPPRLAPAPPPRGQIRPGEAWLADGRLLQAVPGPEASGCHDASLGRHNVARGVDARFASTTAVAASGHRVNLLTTTRSAHRICSRGSF